MVFLVVAPCVGPAAQLSVARCMPHQTPTYLNGFTQETSPSRFGSFRFRTRSDITRPPALSAICIVRQGVLNGAVRVTFADDEDGDNVALNRWPVTRRSHMEE